MSEHLQDVNEVAIQQQGFRELVELRVAETPLPADRAAYVSESFGFDPHIYDVYEDTDRGIEHGFTKFVSKEDPSYQVMGLEWLHVGGALDNPTKSITSAAILPNGDVAGRVVTEGGKNEDIRLSWSASDPDPENRKVHARWVKNLYSKAQERSRTGAMARYDAAHPYSYENQTPVPVAARKGGRFLTRFFRRQAH